MPRRALWKRTGLIAVALGALVALPGAACSLALNFSGIDDGIRDASPDRGSQIGEDAPSDSTLVPIDDAADAAPPLDAPPSQPDAALDGAALDAGADGPCPANLPGPTMVSIVSPNAASFCIDSTEVTVAEYTDFLAAKGGDTSGQAPICAWNTSLVPGNWPPPGPTTQALASVNWCQASFYCQWAGKRLCGTPDGGLADPNGYTDPTQSLWFRVCTRNNDGLHAYPYGDTYDPTACNGADYDAGGPLPSLPTCQGGYPGVFDMSGNVFEWEDRCVTEDSGPNDFCFIRGGAFDQPSTNLRCDEGLEVQRFAQSSDVGFRCCSL